MLRVILVAAVALSSGCASAAAICEHGTDQVLRLDSWTVESDKLGPLVTLNFTNIGKSLRTIRAAARFFDASNVNVGYANIDLDLRAAANQSFSQTKRGSVRMDRLPSIPKAEVSAVICVTDVIYADGTMQRFK